MKKFLLVNFAVLIMMLSLNVQAKNVKSMEDYHHMIMKAYKNEDIKGINDLSDAVIENYPEAGFGYFFKGLAMDLMGEYKSAISYYTKSMELGKIYSDHYQNRGLSYLHDEQYDKAIADYDKALELNPNLKEAKEQREYAINAKKGIIVTTQGNVTNFQSVNDPFYLAEQYYNMPGYRKKEIIDLVKNYSDDILPIYYIAVAEDIYPTDKNLAAFLYAIGRFRSIEDVGMCKDTSAYGAIKGFPYVAPKTAKYIANMKNSSLAELLQKTLEWDIQHPKRPNYKWICYHAMEVFTNDGKVSTLPESKYDKLIEKQRQGLADYIKELQSKK